jgi:hypothetical protein
MYLPVKCGNLLNTIYRCILHFSTKIVLLIVSLKFKKMKSLIKASAATLFLALTNVAAFAAGNGSADNSSLGGAAAVGFFAVMIGALLLPAVGHKAHH